MKTREEIEKKTKLLELIANKTTLRCMAALRHYTIKNENLSFISKKAEDLKSLAVMGSSIANNAFETVQMEESFKSITEIKKQLSSILYYSYIGAELHKQAQEQYRQLNHLTAEIDQARNNLLQLQEKQKLIQRSELDVKAYCKKINESFETLEIDEANTFRISNSRRGSSYG